MGRDEYVSLHAATENNRTFLVFVRIGRFFFVIHIEDLFLLLFFLNVCNTERGGGWIE